MGTVSEDKLNRRAERRARREAAREGRKVQVYDTGRKWPFRYSRTKPIDDVPSTEIIDDIPSTVGGMRGRGVSGYEGSRAQDFVRSLIKQSPAVQDLGMSMGEAIPIRLAQAIDPSNPDVEAVQAFQSQVMGLGPGDPGYGSFGPLTTREWQKVMGY